MWGKGRTFLLNDDLSAYWRFGLVKKKSRDWYIRDRGWEL